ncbi:MAG: hypothetical protein U1F58_02275 [Burkholderiales bacterium]
MDGQGTPKAVAAPALRGPGDDDDDDERPIGDPDPDDGDWDDDDFDDDDDEDPLLVAPAVPDSAIIRPLRRITPAR